MAYNIGEFDFTEIQMTGFILPIGKANDLTCGMADLAAGVLTMVIAFGLILYVLLWLARRRK